MSLINPNKPIINAKELMKKASLFYKETKRLKSLNSLVLGRDVSLFYKKRKFQRKNKAN